MRGFLTKKEFETWLQYLERRLTSVGSSIVTYISHAYKHNTGGADAITALAGEVLTSGTIDGDRLPAISTTKKGAVPAVTAGATELLAKWLKDTGLFERIIQANCDGLKTTDTPQFAGAGIGVAGADNQINLKEAAVIGPTAGPYLKYNLAAKLLEILEGDVNIGNTPTVPGTGGTWTTEYDSDATTIYQIVNWNGALYACGNTKVYSNKSGSWAAVLTVAASHCHTLCVFNGYLYAFFRGDTPIYRTADGTTWANVTPATPTGAPSRAIVFNGVMYACFTWGEVWYTTNGTSWTKGLATTDSMQWGFGMAVFNGALYVAMHNTTAGRVFKFNGTSWSTVLSETTSWGFYGIYVWNGKLYVGRSAGGYFYSADGTNWSAAQSFGVSGTTRDFCEYDGKLLAVAGTDVVASPDGINWSVFHDNADAIYCLLAYGGKIYEGTSTAGKIYVYTDTTYVPAPNETVFGHLTVHGQFRPGDMAGVEGDLFMSGGAAHGSWLARGATGQYVGGVTGGKPIYKVIPASDVVNTPAGAIAATDVQAAINELDTEKQSIAGMDTAVAASFQAAVISHLLCYEGDILTYENEVLYG